MPPAPGSLDFTVDELAIIEEAVAVMLDAWCDLLLEDPSAAPIAGAHSALLVKIRAAIAAPNG